MPAFSTHYIFAKEIMQDLKSIADFEINEDAVYYGTQGPDIFFFHRIFPWMLGKSLRSYGSKLHRAQPAVLFENMRKYCEISNDKSIAKSYIYGFFLHYALDRNCHPYVYSLQNKIVKEHKFTNPHTAHHNIEFSMDSYLLNKHLGIIEPRKFNTAQTISDNSRVITEISRLLSYTVGKTLNMPITPKQVATALTDTKAIEKITYDPKGYKRFLIVPIEIIAAPISRNFKFTSMMRPKDLENAKKYGNINHKQWISPYCDGTRNESFEDLFEKAKLDAKAMIIKFQNGTGTNEITENLSFLTGVEVK